MKILLVEDRQEKLLEINKLLTELNINNYLFDHAKDAKECLSFVESNKYDVLILDICIPYNFSTDLPNIQTGRELLYQINNETEIYKPGIIIGLTSEVTTLDEIKQSFEKQIWKLFEVSVNSHQWKIELLSLLKYLSLSKDKYYCDIFVNCALEEEAQQVTNLLINSEQVKIHGLPYYFYKGDYIDSSKIKHNVLVGHQAKMGNLETALFLSSCLNHIIPKAVGMSGILAGIKSELNYGDIVIAEQSWDYNAGKFVEIEGEDLNFIPDPDPINIPNSNYHMLQSYVESPETKKFLDQIYIDWPAKKPKTKLELKYGFVASGSAVVNSKSVLEWIKNQKRKYLALEMEIYAFYKTINLLKNNIPCIAVKSVADFGDGSKNDEYHEYASYTSAQILLHFLSNRLNKSKLTK